MNFSISHQVWNPGHWATWLSCLSDLQIFNIHLHPCGANRGLGLGFVRRLVSRDSCHVLACCRNPSAAAELLALREKYPGRLSLEQLDVANDDEISALHSKWPL